MPTPQTNIVNDGPTLFDHLSATSVSLAAPKTSQPATTDISLPLFPIATDGSEKKIGIEVRAVRGRHNVLLRQSPSTLTKNDFCQRASFLHNERPKNEPEGMERKILRYLSGYDAALGDAVHDGIHRILHAHRQQLTSDQRTLKHSEKLNFERVVEDAYKGFERRIVASWLENYPRGHPTRGEPRYREHVLEKARQVRTGDVKVKDGRVIYSPEPPDLAKLERCKEEIVRSLRNWHQLFYEDQSRAHERDPRSLIPKGGLSGIHPLLILELEERAVSYRTTDGFEKLRPGESEFPYYEIEVPMQGVGVGSHSNKDTPALFVFQMSTVIDLMYLHFTERGEPRLVIADWKTNKLDEYSGAVHAITKEQQDDQLRHYCLYALKRYGDVFERFRPQIEMAAQALGITPQIPKRLEPHHIYCGDVYLRGDGLPRELRFSPKCAADLDLHAFEFRLRRELSEIAHKFDNIDPLVTTLERWAPTGLARRACKICNQAKHCPDAPGEVRAVWPEARLQDILAGLVLPARPEAALAPHAAQATVSSSLFG